MCRFIDYRGKTPDKTVTGIPLITAKNVQITPHLRNLYDHLSENHHIDCIAGFDREVLGVFSRDVMTRIRDCDSSWEKMVPPSVATAIKERRLFGYTKPPETVRSTAAGDVGH